MKGCDVSLIKRNKTIKRKTVVSFIGILLIILTLLVSGFLLAETRLSYKDLNYVMPQVERHEQYVYISGSIKIDSLYITRPIYTVKERVLIVYLKGLRIPISRMEGEYHFQLDVNRDLYDSIEFRGIGEEEYIL